jgi:hypothetical protein
VLFVHGSALYRQKIRVRNRDEPLRRFAKRRRTLSHFLIAKRTTLVLFGNRMNERHIQWWTLN